MGNVLQILVRDFKRLLKAPAALIVVGALLVLPSLYTWYNVVAFWDPYGATGDLRVCVVNQDKGTTNETTGQLDIGAKLIEELQANDQLKWVTDEDYDTAMQDLRVGDAYAVYVIPEDFSACLVSPLTGEIKQPRIEYYANEKLGPVSPKITDTAASALEQKINSAFVSTVTETVAQTIGDAIAEADADVAAAKVKAANRADEAKVAVSEARTALAGVADTIDGLRAKVDKANEAIGGVSTISSDARAVLKDVTDEATALQSSLTGMSSESVPELSEVLTGLSRITSKAGTLAGDVATSAGKAQADADMAAAKLQPIVDAMRESTSDLEAAAAAISNEDLSGRLAQAAQDMAARADEMQAVLDGATALAAQAKNASQTAAKAAGKLDDAVTKASDSFEQYASALHGSTAATVNSGVTQVSAVCARLSAAVSSLDATVDQVKPILGELDDVLVDCKGAALQTDALVGATQSGLDSVVADVRLLAESEVIANLLDNGTLNAQNIAAFMGAPTELATTEFYNPNAYGTAMAPLFMNLSFWIGAFMLVIIFLLEVDSTGIEGLKPWQRYLGRFLLFCPMAIVQAIICCAGTLALGVQVANVPALFVAACVAALAYLSVIYALSATFRHVGKALCIVLVFAQIPGGSGLYPVEMTSGFFQAIYPFLPFTYGIDALREAIGGFYGSYFAHDLLALGAFFVVNMALGLVLGPLMSNVVGMTARQVYEGDLYNGEDAETPERPFRLYQVLRAITEKRSYREELETRYARFSRRYPIFIRASIVLGVGVSVALGVLGALDTTEKTVLLTVFLLWLIALIAFLVVVEAQRHSFERQLNLENLSDERLLRIFANRDRMVRVGAFRGMRGEATGHGGTAWRRGSGNATGGIRNVWLIARRDFQGLFKNVMSTVITIGLVALPSLFALYNILACWNVFDNTDQLSVAVASEDEGFESDLLPMNVNVGEKVVSALRANDDINWVFTNADDAVEGVKAGTYYAALVIPTNFSQEMLTFYEGDSASASIDYYVNKKNAIAPNITGIGADTVSQEVNSVFAGTVTEVVLAASKSLSSIAEDGDVGGRVAQLAEHMRGVADTLEQSAGALDVYSLLGKDAQGLVHGSAEVASSAHAKLQDAASDIEAGKKRLSGLSGTLGDSVDELAASLKTADSAIAKLEARADALVADATDDASAIAAKLRDAASGIDAKAAGLSDQLAVLEELRDALQSGSNVQIDADVQDGKANVTVDLGNGNAYRSDEALSEDIEALSSTISSLEDAKAALEEAISAELAESNPELQQKLDDIEATITRLSETRSTLQALLDSRVDVDVDIEAALSAEAGAMVENTIVLDKDIAALKKAIEILQNASAGCTGAAETLESGAADIADEAASLRKLVKAAGKDAAAVKADLANGLEPGIDQLKSGVATLVGNLEKGVAKLRSLDPDLAGSLESAATGLGDASAKTDAASAKLRAAAQRVRTLAGAVDDALASGDVEKLRSLVQGSAGDLAAALTAPVHIERTALYPSDNFGSAMTPLYCTLALFIGSLLIMVAMKPEVSRRGREELVDPKPRHLYFGRFMAVAAVSLMQTTVLGLGCLLFLKVQAVHPLLFMLGFWFSGLVLAFMIYTLVVAFGNLGKAIAVLLLIVQVTACGGSYPLQMLPDFVQAISPWVPATYIVDLLRAAMMGVYQNDFWISMGYLALFIIPFLLLGLALRKPMERFMKFYVSKVEECGIMG
ncbi:MAG: YhgE/Pip domain-containing protein [Coriobacteriaceae bacterium]|nr:YhgE/Pip domain-containing protein [Coriobacteriaceae bacterium]